MNNNKDYFIIDDVISEHHQEHIEKVVTQKNSWRFQKGVCFRSNEENIDSTMGFSQAFFHINQGGVLSDIFNNTIMPLVYEISKKANVSFKQVAVARSFALLPLAKQFRRKYDCVHIDIDSPHWVFLYYINDSDGDTVLFDKTTEEFPYKGSGIDYKKNKFKELVRVTPKKGRVVVFKGNRYHTSTNPTIGPRFIINVNVLI